METFTNLDPRNKTRQQKKSALPKKIYLQENLNYQRKPQSNLGNPNGSTTVDLSSWISSKMASGEITGGGIYSGDGTISGGNDLNNGYDKTTIGTLPASSIFMLTSNYTNWWDDGGTGDTGISISASDKTEEEWPNSNQVYLSADGLSTYSYLNLYGDSLNASGDWSVSNNASQVNITLSVRDDEEENPDSAQLEIFTRLGATNNSVSYLQHSTDTPGGAIHEFRKSSNRLVLIGETEEGWQGMIFPEINEYDDDLDAASDDCPIGGVYHTLGTLKVRVA